MNKKKTKNTRSTLSLTAEVFWNLFHKDSPNSLIRAQDLAFIDVDYLKFIFSNIVDKKEFEWFDKKELQFLNLGTMVLFFQYFGIISAFFIVNLGAICAYLLFTNQVPVYQAQSVKAETISRASSIKPLVKQYTYLDNTNAHVSKRVLVVAKAPINIEEAKKEIPESKALSALIAYQNDSKVLGAKTVSNDDVVGKCSFKQGNKLYTNNSKVLIDNADTNSQICVGAKNANAVSFLWDVEGNNSRGNCIDLSSYQLTNDNVKVFVNVDDGQNSSNCSLLVEKIY